ncbi:hypothetical protein NDU88_002215 [Pleurodeles waltl]|uniref:Uncharacterized protein n=1 Tax=Pleurodeles waltl TaxID=8319 RepID=A0AAV7KUZ9_PLEWA|nr:hypothetical protein NDU88_002215 [Pleurodeles waltl]
MLTIAEGGKEWKCSRLEEHFVSKVISRLVNSLSAQLVGGGRGALTQAAGRKQGCCMSFPYWGELPSARDGCALPQSSLSCQGSSRRCQALQAEARDLGPVCRPSWEQLITSAAGRRTAAKPLTTCF